MNRDSVQASSRRRRADSRDEHSGMKRELHEEALCHYFGDDQRHFHFFNQNDQIISQVT
jgi:hypothetical protein